MVELKNKAALQQAKINLDGFEKINALGITPDIFVYLQNKDQFDIRARMFAPFDGIMEDPATGSACCALVGLLSSLSGEIEGDFKWKIAQGVEMGRPSFLQARTEKKGGEVTGVWIGGDCVMMSNGIMNIG
jgi:trans-2,3-dihydro-3-hydroxyanthranilate isomerase